MKIWHAEYTSRHFFFEAFGMTRQEALDALVAGLKAHAHAYEIETDDWYALDDLCVREVTLGEAYRDREPV